MVRGGGVKKGAGSDRGEVPVPFFVKPAAFVRASL